MKRVVTIWAATALATLALAGCGHSDSANAPASADNVEMPAEEALSGVAATPAADPSATATETATETGAPSAANGGANAASAATAGTSAATEAASSPAGGARR